jgi:hypothetical protein
VYAKVFSQLQGMQKKKPFQIMLLKSALLNKILITEISQLNIKGYFRWNTLGKNYIMKIIFSHLIKELNRNVNRNVNRHFVVKRHNFISFALFHCDAI